MKSDAQGKSTAPERPWLVALDERLPLASHAHIGGKARSLLRLRALGLPTPVAYATATALLPDFLPYDLNLPRVLDADGVATLHALAARTRAQPLPDGLRTALGEALTALDRAWQAANPSFDGDDNNADDDIKLHTGFSVRSSFANEDDPRRLAPGIYASRIGVAANEVVAAVTQVLASAIDAPAVAYASFRGEDPLAGPHAILLHRTVIGHAHGHAIWTKTEGVTIETRTGALPRDERVHLCRLLDAAARRADNRRAFETEWVATRTGFVFLQWRPVVEPAPEARPDARPDERPWPEGWQWDAAHNPLPLSLAQADLVARMDALATLPIEQRVHGGYLFWRQRQDHGIAAQPSPDPRVLAETITRERRALPDPPTLPEALAFFTRHYPAIVGGLSARARAGRRALAAFLAQHLPGYSEATLAALLTQVPSLATERARALARLVHAPGEPERAAALAAFLDHFGDESSVWDVAHPTRREAPQDILARAAGLARTPAASEARDDAQIACQRILAQLPEGLHDEFLRLLQAARAAAALGEDDDGLYAQIQAPVRAALLNLGRRLAQLGRIAQAEDVFFLSLDVALSLSSQTSGPTGAKLRAAIAEARGLYRTALGRPPPLPALPSQIARAESLLGAGLWRGIGTRGRAVGTVVHHRPDALARGASPDDTILVATTILPTELPLLCARAIVTETGGALDHVAAQCRERGLPAVVGVPGAVAGLPEGSPILVDADAGLVLALESAR